MADAICDTSPLQYMHQVDLLELFPQLVGTILVPPAVVDELEVGRSYGLNLPDPHSHQWIDVRAPSSVRALPPVTDLGPRETAVLAFALEHPVWMTPEPAGRPTYCTLV